MTVTTSPDRTFDGTGPETVYTVKEAADLLKVRPPYVYNMCAFGTLRHVRIGRSIRVPESALREFINSGGDEGATFARAAGRVEAGRLAAGQ